MITRQVLLDEDVQVILDAGASEPIPDDPPARGTLAP